MRMARFPVRSAAIGLEDLAHLAAHVRALERERDVGFQEPDLVAAVEAAAFEAHAVERHQAEQVGERVGQLDLAAGAALLPIEIKKYLRLQDVSPDHRQ